ncbi:MAG: NAD(P)H-hydrate dehydratase [Acetobacteraceae bacterium]|nr:NAD(P)H-hydrate dehydratase [Acetobacteraceae bacterium]
MTPSAPVPLLLPTPAEMARADAAAIASGVPGPVLMEAAGRALARAVRRRFRPVRTLVLAGPGNNGGDGYVAARHLEQAGWPVAVAPLAPPRAGSDAARAAALWRGPRLPFAAAEAARAGLVLDCVFGAGLDRPLPEAVAEVLAAAGGPIVAADVPSGLDGATGQPLGRVAPAALTVTFARLKPGHLLLPGRMLCGETVVADIGLPDAAVAGSGARLWRNAPGLWRPPPLAADAHKWSRGAVLVAGGAEMPGAARLAAAAARRAGAGHVAILAPPGQGGLFRAAEAGLVVSEAPLPALLDRPRTVVLGPGLPPDAATRALLAEALASGAPVVADAGALTACAGRAEALRGVALLTPHEGEFARLFGPPGPDRVAAVRAAAARVGAVVLLKGPATVIAASDGRAAIEAGGPPDLATAGTGDVLAGVAGALLARGMPAFEAAAAAAWLLAEAARRGGPGLIAEDLPPLLPAALAAARTG